MTEFFLTKAEFILKAKYRGIRSPAIGMGGSKIVLIHINDANSI